MEIIYKHCKLAANFFNMQTGQGNLLVTVTIKIIYPLSFTSSHHICYICFISKVFAPMRHVCSFTRLHSFPSIITFTIFTIFVCFHIRWTKSLTKGSNCTKITQKCQSGNETLFYSLVVYII